MKLKGWSLAVVGAVIGLAALDNTPNESSSGIRATSTTVSKPTTQSIPSYKTQYVTGSVVNVRSGPSTSYYKIFQLKRGQSVQALTSENGWIKLSINNRVGWMSGKYLSATKPSTQSQPAQTAPPPNRKCHPSYTGACVPIASDVDCAGGRGNGPAYVRGPVRVIGPDVYRLDRDRDGIGCE